MIHLRTIEKLVLRGRVLLFKRRPESLVRWRKFGDRVLSSPLGSHKKLEKPFKSSGRLIAAPILSVLVEFLI